MGPKMAAVTENWYIKAIEATTVEVADWNSETSLAFR